MDNIKEFANRVREEIERNYLNTVEVKVQEILKNNGVCLTGLTIIRENSNLSPTVYINELYDEYINGNMSIVGIAATIMDTYEHNRISENVDMSFFLKYESVKSMLYCKLINLESNRELLSEVPHEVFLDLAIVPYCLLRKEDIDTGGTASILIRNSHVKNWGISRKEVLKDAMANTREKQGSQITDMKTVLKDITGMIIPDDCDMYVMTGKNKVNGAISMTDTDALMRFAGKIKKDLFIIPSSIHEVILVPTDSDEDMDTMNEMVVSVNDTEVAREEILSDHVYYFSKEYGYGDDPGVKKAEPGVIGAMEGS
ncbi:MAG: DUF5688 family protein [Lachnospiraceae bacterium]|nr:DUF5688 family protein [Lachnospiraceae bacterium]